MSLGGSFSKDKSSWDQEQETVKMQDEQLKRLLEMSDSFLDSGAYDDSGNEFLDQTLSGITGMSDYYNQVLTGEPDTTALQGALAAQQSASSDALATDVANLGSMANLAGGAGGSRQGIAEGIATGKSNAALQQTQAGTINAFTQYNQDRQMQAAQGIGQTAGMYASVQDQYESEADKRMKSLLAYQSLISGDMGGTSYGSGSNTSTSYGITAQGSAPGG